MAQRENILLPSRTKTIKDMIKDGVDTFKPYKNWRYYPMRDLLQPLRGACNTLIASIGLATLALIVPIALIVVSVWLLTAVAWSIVPLYTRNFGNYLSGLRKDFVEGTEDSLKAVNAFSEFSFLLLRGLTQILSSPFALFIKFPLRVCITFAMGHPKIENEASFNRNYVKASENLVKVNAAAKPQVVSELMLAIKAMHTKLKKNKVSGTPSDINLRSENKTYGMLKEAHIKYHKDYTDILLGHIANEGTDSDKQLKASDVSGNQELFDSLKLRYFEAIGGADNKQLTDLNQKHQKDILLHAAHFLKTVFPNRNLPDEINQPAIPG